MKLNRHFTSAIYFFVCVGALLLWSSIAWSAQGPLATVGDRIPALNWEPRSDWISVKEAGAVGDGQTDDTAAIQKVLDGVQTGQTVYLPAGNYRITQTLTFTGPLSGILVVGHGRDTQLVWDGEENGKLFTDDGVAHSRYVGIVFDGRNKAGIGFWHHSNARFETEVLHQHLAFLNFTEAAVATSNTDRHALAETLFENCLFDNCAKGVSFRSFNDYNFTFSGCEFVNCGIGIEGIHGTMNVRDSHFRGSKNVDIYSAGEHNSSVRRVTSVGSRSFLVTASGVAAVTVQDCHVDGWTYTEGAVNLHGAPVMMFDCVFTNPPANTEPVRIRERGNIFGSGALQLISSENRAEGSPALIGPGHSGRVYNVPAGERKGSIRSAEQRFLQNIARIPRKVFDAKRDFGAMGDRKTDDTKAIQAAIDAARAHGQDAIAYLPTGRYLVSETLRITGRDYFVGGSGLWSGLVWAGEEGGTMVAVHDPLNVQLEHINVGSHDVGEMKNGIDIHHTSSGKTSFMKYDGVHVYGLYQKQPERKGLRFTGLGKDDTVLMGHVQGNLQFTECARATILANTTYEGSIIIQGKDKLRDGFLGFLTRLATGVTHALYLRDNHSFVASDFYIEQSDDGLVLEGAPGDPPGRVTLQGAKLRINLREDGTPTNTLAIRNYQGQIFYGPQQFYLNAAYKGPGPSDNLILQEGERPVELFISGVSFYDLAPDIKQESLKVFTTGNWMSRPMEHLVGHAPSERTLQQLSKGMDDLRRLGELDLCLNFPN